MTPEELEEAKTEMKNYIDFFGGSLRNKDEIDGAKSVEDLDAIFSSHHDFLMDMAIDAQTSLEQFKRKLGISQYIS